MKPQKAFTYIKNNKIDRDVKTLFDYISRLEVVTTNPDGSRNGKKGETVLLQTGGNSYVEVNTDGATTWRGVILTDTP